MSPRNYKFRFHPLVHQSARHERSGGLSTAKSHDFSARVFSDRYQNADIPIFCVILVQKWGWDGVGVGVGLWFDLGWVISLLILEGIKQIAALN